MELDDLISNLAVRLNQMVQNETTTPEQIALLTREVAELKRVSKPPFLSTYRIEPQPGIASYSLNALEGIPQICVVDGLVLSHNKWEYVEADKTFRLRLGYRFPANSVVELYIVLT